MTLDHERIVKFRLWVSSELNIYLRARITRRKFLFNLQRTCDIYMYGKSLYTCCCSWYFSHDTTLLRCVPYIIYRSEMLSKLLQPYMDKDVWHFYHFFLLWLSMCVNYHEIIDFFINWWFSIIKYMLIIHLFENLEKEKR